MEQSKWQMKMNSIPLQEDADGAWSEMEALLNLHQPVVASASLASTMKKVVAKLVSMLGYALPAAAMISTGTYLYLQKPTHQSRNPIPVTTPPPKVRSLKKPSKATTDTIPFVARDEHKRSTVDTSSYALQELKPAKAASKPIKKVNGKRVRNSQSGVQVKDTVTVQKNQLRRRLSEPSLPIDTIPKQKPRARKKVADTASTVPSTGHH